MKQLAIIAILVMLALLALPVAGAAPGVSLDVKDAPRWSILRHRPAVEATATVPTALAPVGLILDDGGHEADVGFSGTTAFQFLWFNRFTLPAVGAAFDLAEIQVLFPTGPEVVPGAAIQLVVFHDVDGDPTNGADLITAFDDVIQVADGATLSIYPVTPPLRLAPAGDVLIGVINRFVVSGVSPPSRPAALDTTSSAGRSWVALWTSDPPDPPLLPSDNLLTTIDVIEPGNWLIRASGAPVSVLEIPVLGGAGLASLAVLLMLAAIVLLRR